MGCSAQRRRARLLPGACLLALFVGCDAAPSPNGARDAAAGDRAAPFADAGDDAGAPRDGGAPADGPRADQAAPRALWATAYYAGWQQELLPPDAIDYTALTHVIHFSLVVNADGTLDAQENGVSAARSAAAVQAAHAAGKQILISIGGAGSAAGFHSATASATRAKLVAAIVELAERRGYDGVDIDWEPVADADASRFLALAAELRAALPQKLLTAAVGAEHALLAKAHKHFDQINVMTYDLSGAWQGWLTWHNAPIFSGGCTFASTGQPVPSAHAQLQGFIDAGVPARKLGLGIDFYGYVWSGGAGTTTGGVTRPCQTYTSDPQVTMNLSYAQIMAQYFTAQRYVWDADAEAAYLSIDKSDPAGDKFISYDDEQSVRHKVDYARAHGLGGVFVWELGGGYRAEQPAGQRDLLLQALKQATCPSSSSCGAPPARGPRR